MTPRIHGLFACVLLAVVGAGEPVVLQCQIFVDGDPAGLLYTQHVGGFLGHGVSFADYNGDGFDDLTFAQFEGNIMAYAGDGAGGFQADELGIGNTGGEPKAALWADFDNDGDQDLLITQRLAPNLLFARMPDGSLQAVPDAGGMAGSSLERTFGASVADFDKDGRLDVYLCHYHTPQTNNEENRLFRSTGGSDLCMTFVDVTEEAGVGNGVKQSFQATWIDVDRDGWLDLHVINDRTFWPDALFRNQGDGTFVDEATLWGIDIGQYSMSSSFADFDKDQDWDIVVTNGASEGVNFLRCMGHPFVNPDNEPVTLNYTNVAPQAGVLLEDLSWGALWFDADNNGWLDLFIGTGTSLYTDYPTVLGYYPNNENGFFLNNAGVFPLTPAFDNVFTDNELTFSSAFADHNRDGALDFVSHRMGPRARLLNGVPNGNSWIQFRLEPSSGNSDAIGSVITVWKGGVGDMRTVTCGSEYLNQNSRRLHFGLGGGPASLDSVVVDWPSGNHVSYTNLGLNLIHTLYEAGGAGQVVTEGCAYPMACNYQPSVTIDNGTCDFACTCGTGTVWDAILQQCVVSCTADQDGDGAIGTGDLIIFLTFFGLACP